MSMNRENIYKEFFKKLCFCEQQYLNAPNEEIAKLFLNELIQFHQEFFKEHNKRVRDYFYKHQDEEKYKDYFEYKSFERDYFLDVQDGDFLPCYIYHLNNMKNKNIKNIEDSASLISFEKFRIFVEGLNYLITKFS